jgi:hypothetical protein
MATFGARIRSVKVTAFEGRQMTAVRKEHEHEAPQCKPSMDEAQEGRDIDETVKAR